MKFRIKNYQSGQAIITAVVFFLLVAILLISSAVIYTTKRASGSNRLLTSRKSYFTAEAGLEDVTYRVMKGKNYISTEVLNIDDFTATTTVVNTVGSDKEITTVGNAINNIRKNKITLTTDVGADFFYGVQSGAGGISVGNGTAFNGSLYSNGPISGVNNLMYGTAVSAGPSGLINSIHATGTAYAHSITNSTIDKDAYYFSNVTGTTVLGAKHPDNPDLPLLDMPINDAKVQSWENSASAKVLSGCSGGSLTLNTATTTGPAKIPCNLILNTTLTMTGPIWVEGSISLGSSNVKIDPSLGKDSLALIADKPSDRLNSSNITMTNGAQFSGTGDPLSYVTLVSMNNSAENNGAVIAIDVNNNLNGDLFIYAPHGLIDIKNGSKLIGMAGYKINIKNNATITYETGLASMLFESGPGGSYYIRKWEETQ